MKKPSKSPERNTFQRNAYLERCAKDGVEPSPSYLEMWETVDKQDTEWAEREHTNDLEYELRTCDWMLNKVRSSDEYAQNLYAAMCNNEFMKLEVIPILKEQTWSCTWRYAGGIIADMQEKGDYIDWYCSGMGGLTGEYPEGGRKENYVGEGTVTDEVRGDLLKLGWKVIDDDEMA